MRNIMKSKLTILPKNFNLSMNLNSIFTIVFVSFSLSYFNVTPILAQTNKIENKTEKKEVEKIQLFKKLKLIEVLKINDETAEQLLLKLNYFEAQMKSKNAEIQSSLSQLHEIVKSKKNTASIKEQNDKLLKLYDELQNLSKNRLLAVRQILDEENYAKFLLFESRFRKELREHLKKQRQRPKF